jgi:hypothetical protein
MEPEERLHAKNKAAIMLRPFWRVSISLNDEPKNLMILPPLDPSILDKLMLFQVSQSDCLPTDAKGERQKFAADIDRELPAFVYYLVHNHEIRQELDSGRTGITSYYNPNLVSELEEISPEAALMSLIQLGLFPKHSTADAWEGSPSELYDHLKGSGSSVKSDAEKLFNSPDKLGRLLKTLEKSNGDYQGAAKSRRTSRGRLYQINRRYRDCDRE